tara:strand:- start:182 stop:421 length:240 start_codon:yes stop_codon:yes gene_type:complete
MKNLILRGDNLCDETIDLIMTNYKQYKTQPLTAKLLNNILNIQRNYLQNYDRNMNNLLMEICLIDIEVYMKLSDKLQEK